MFIEQISAAKTAETIGAHQPLRQLLPRSRPFIRHLGPLKEPTTNQRLYRKTDTNDFEDITSRFWRR